MDLQKAPRKGDKKEDAVLEKCSIKGDKRCFSMEYWLHFYLVCYALLDNLKLFLPNFLLKFHSVKE
jgi:hypothetical protein